jgi:hypothetical protein
MKSDGSAILKKISGSRTEIYDRYRCPMDPDSRILLVRISVADPDPPDPRVFGPPGSGTGSTSQRYGSGSGSCSGSGSFYHHAKIVLKTLTLFDFLSLKNDVNVASKSNKQKKLC